MAIRWRTGFGWLALVAAGVALGALPVQWAAALVAGAATILLSLARPELGLGLLAISVPFGSLAEFHVGGLPLSATELLTGLMLLCGIAVVAARGKLRLGPLFWPLGFYIGVLVLSVALATDKSAAVKEVLRWTEALAAYLVAASVIDNQKQRRQFLALALLAGSAVALVGWAQFFLRLGPDGFRVGPFLRAYGTFGQPNPFGGYLGMILPLAAALAILWRTKQPEVQQEPAWTWIPEISPHQLHRLAWATMILVGLAMLMSMSRGAWLGAFVALSLIMIIRGRRTALALAGFISVGLLIMFAGTLNLLPQAIASRLFTVVSYFGVFDVRYVTVTPDNWPVVERMAQWQTAWEMFQDHYYFGVGAGNYNGYYSQYSYPDWPKSLGHAHNYYLNALAETGVVGLGAFATMIGSWLWVAVRRSWEGWRRAPGSEGWATTVGILGVILAVATHSLFDNLFVHGMNVHIGLLLGVLVGGGYCDK
jgi:putative inorganic carbon (hco3(-)) transporter